MANSIETQKKKNLKLIWTKGLPGYMYKNKEIKFTDRYENKFMEKYFNEKI